MQRSRIIVAGGLGLATLLPLTGVADETAFPDPPPASPADVLTFIGFDDTDLQRLRDGEIISRDLYERTNKELAVAVAMVLPGESVDDLASWAIEGQGLAQDPNLLSLEELDDTGEAITRLQFVEGGAEEMTRLAGEDPAAWFNLGEYETEQLLLASTAAQEIGADAGEAARVAYGRLLRERYWDYVQGGMGAIASFDRSNGKRSLPREELAGALTSETILLHLPSFYPPFSHFPRFDRDDVRNQFYLSQQRLAGRPTVILSHRMFQVQPGQHALMGERQFYVGHTYNSRQIVAGAMQVDSGTLVLYMSRTSTDLIDLGTDSPAARELGRGAVRDKLIENFRELAAARRALREGG